MVPHDVPVVVRVQAVVSVSVVVAELHELLPHVYVVTMRVREPLVEQVAAYEQVPHAPVLVVLQLWPLVVRVQPVVSVSVAVVLPHEPAWHTGSVRVRVREPVSLQVLAKVHEP